MSGREKFEEVKKDAWQGRRSLGGKRVPRKEVKRLPGREVGPKK